MYLRRSLSIIPFIYTQTSFLPPIYTHLILHALHQGFLKFHSPVFHSVHVQHCSYNSKHLLLFFRIFSVFELMLMEKTMRDRNGKENGELNKKRRRRRRIYVSRVQKLYQTCKQVFANCKPGVVPSPENVQRVKAVLGRLFSFEVLRMNL